MSTVVLRDGRVLELTPDQQGALGMTILMTASMNRRVKVGAEQFSLNDIVTDPEEISRLMQTKLVDIRSAPVYRRGGIELA